MPFTPLQKAEILKKVAHKTARYYEAYAHEREEENAQRGLEKDMQHLQ